MLTIHRDEDELPALSILFADDEPAIQEVMRRKLPRMGHRVTICPDGETAIAAMERETFDCILVDYNMPGKNGIEVIEAAHSMQPSAETVIMTGRPSNDTALSAIQNGVFDYLTKPTKFEELGKVLRRIAQRQSDKRILQALQQRLKHQGDANQMIGGGDAMADLRRLIQRVAPTEATVLIRGETGCGKELVAAQVHAASLRGDMPMVPINCGALPEHLIESELFGHCKGAFTGADSAREGLFEVANRGTIFLDEIGELPLAMQAKLLRVLETGDIRRLGDNRTTNVDVRVICATHRDLDQMVAEGTFREDLMFRINTFEVHVPPLRRRVEDIAPLAQHFLAKHRATDGKEALTAAAIERLEGHSWPGNVRELANVIEHSAILSDSLPIDADDLPNHFGRSKLRKSVADTEPKTLKELEQMAIDAAMTRHDGNKPAVADELGVSLKTLYNRLNAAEVRQAG